MSKDIKHAEDILAKAWERAEARKLTEERHRQLYNAGVPGVLDPDLYRVRSHADLDDELARFMGLIPPRRGRVMTSELDRMRMEANIDEHFRPGLAKDEEICGYCGHVKKKGEWCGRYRCSSNEKRRGQR